MLHLWAAEAVSPRGDETAEEAVEVAEAAEDRSSRGERDQGFDRTMKTRNEALAATNGKAPELKKKRKRKRGEKSKIEFIFLWSEPPIYG